MNETRIEYHGELEDLRSDLIRLGAMVAEAIGRGTAALLDRDLHAAQVVIDGDDLIDDFCLGLEERCYLILALQSPIAGELRFVLATIRLISELERSADLVVNVCKASRRIYDIEFGPQIRGLIEQMGVEATFLIRSAIDAYVDSNTSLATALDDIDDRLDELQVSYMQAILRSHSETDLNLQGAVQMAMIGRYYERIGDHAVNIGERVNYMVTGWLPEKSGSARYRLKESEAREHQQLEEISLEAMLDLSGLDQGKPGPGSADAHQSDQPNSGPPDPTEPHEET